MAWELDPDLALHTRLSFGRHAVLVAVVILTGLGLAVTIARAPAIEFLILLAGASLAALVVSLPFGAIHILALDRDGRLDQQRMSGRSDERLAVVLFGGASGLLLLLGLPAFLLGHHLGMSPIQIAALVAASAAAANLLLVVRRASDAETPMLAGIAVLFTLFSSLAVASLPLAATFLILIGAAVWIATLPFVLARLRRPAAGARRSAAVLRPLLPMRTARLPEFTRGLLSKARAWWMVAGVAAVPLLMLLAVERRDMRNGREGLSGALLYILAVVAGLDASGRARRERVSDGLDRICLSGQRRWSVVVQLVASYALPYIAVMATALVARLWLNPPSVWIFGRWPVAALVMSSVGIAEGLRGRRLGTYVLPATLAGIAAMNPGHDGPTVWLVCTALWIPLVVTAQCLERQDGPPIPPRLVPVATAALAIALTALLFLDNDTYQRGYGMFLAGWMSLAAGLLLPDRRQGVGPRIFAAAAVTCAVAVAVTEYFSLDADVVRHIFATSQPPRMDWPSTRAMLHGGLAACGLLYGGLAHTRFAAVRSTSLLARLFPLLFALVLFAAGRWSVRSAVIDASFAAVLVIAAALLWFLPFGGRHARAQS